MSWLTRIFGLSDQPVSTPPAPDDDYWYETYEGVGVPSVSQALSIPAFASGLRYKAETLASLPAQIHERAADGGRPVARDHDAYSLLHSQPNERMSSFEFYRRIVFDLELYGGHLSVLRTNANNVVTSVDPQDMTTVQLVKDQQLGIRLFRVTDGVSTRFYAESEVLFIPGPFSSEYKLVSTRHQFAATLQVLLTARKYVSNYFQSGGVGPIYAHFKDILKPDVKTTWSNWFSKNWGGARNVGRIPVMDGAELRTLNIKHSEMQLMELQAFYITETARTLRCPPHKVGDLTRSTNNNIEHQGIEAVIDCIRPLASIVEQRVNISVLGPRERERFYFEFDLNGLLRGDSAAQAALLSAEFQNAAITPNEIRVIRNRPKSKDPLADELFVQGATIPLSLVGQEQQQQQAQEVRK